MQPVDWQTEVPPSLYAARELSIRTESTAAQVTGDGQLAAQVALCTMEIVTNIVRHGWRGASGETIGVRFTIEPSRLELAVRYRGEPFDWQVPESLATRRYEPRDGGFGLIMLHAFADRLEVHEDGGIVHLLLARRFDAGVAEAA